MPIDYRQYPADWKTVIRPRILERDGHCCKHCGIANYTEGWRMPSGRFITVQAWASEAIDPEDEDAFIKILKKKPQPYKIILTIAHLDHQLIDHSDDNLAALCQRCHLNHDRAVVAPVRRQNRRYSHLKRQLHLAFLGRPQPR